MEKRNLILHPYPHRNATATLLPLVTTHLTFRRSSCLFLSTSWNFCCCSSALLINKSFCLSLRKRLRVCTVNDWILKCLLSIERLVSNTSPSQIAILRWAPLSIRRPVSNRRPSQIAILRWAPLSIKRPVSNRRPSQIAILRWAPLSIKRHIIRCYYKKNCSITIL